MILCFWVNLKNSFQRSAGWAAHWEMQTLLTGLSGLLQNELFSSFLLSLICERWVINILIPQPKNGVAIGFFLTQVVKVRDATQKGQQRTIFGSALRLWTMIMDGREFISWIMNPLHVATGVCLTEMFLRRQGTGAGSWKSACRGPMSFPFIPCRCEILTQVLKSWETDI